MRHVFETMGTVASIELPPGFSRHLPGIEAVFRHIEDRFSLYSPHSELSRVATGDLSLLDASDAVRASYARAIGWRAATGGLFSVHRPDGVLDLNGIVKAEAIEQAGALLDDFGCPAWTINVGGDILVRGEPEHWVTGIADPQSRGSILGTVALGGQRRAMATSGSAERGDHIWLGAQTAPAHFTQVSVIAADIVTADVLATAIVAGGRAALDDICDRWPVDVLVVDRQGDLAASPAFFNAKSPAHPRR